MVKMKKKPNDLHVYHGMKDKNESGETNKRQFGTFFFRSVQNLCRVIFCSIHGMREAKRGFLKRWEENTLLSVYWNGGTKWLMKNNKYELSEPVRDNWNRATEKIIRRRYRRRGKMTKNTSKRRH